MAIYLISYLIIVVPMFGLLLRSVTTLIYGTRGPIGKHAWVYYFLRWTGAAIFVGSIGLMLLPVAFGFGGALMLFVGYTIIEWLQASRDLQRNSIWTVIVNSQRNNRSLSESLRLHAPRFKGIVGRSYRRLLASLDNGESLPEAINKSRNCIPPSALATISLFSDEPLPADPRMAGVMPTRVLNLWNRIYFLFSYLLCVMIIGLGIVTFFMLAIIPAFQKIFEDFSLEIPKLTNSVITASSLFVGSGLGTLILLLVLVLVLILMVVFVCYLFDFPILRPYLSWVGWFNHQSQILYLLAEAISRKQTLITAIGRLTQSQPGYAYAIAVNRLRKAEIMMSNGHGWVDSFYRSKLIRKRDKGLLLIASKAGNLDWVLRRISDDILDRSVLRWGILEKTVLPLIVVCFGMIVGWIVIGLFVPLVYLINNLL